MFQNRQAAAKELGERLKGHSFHDALVLAIPGGGVPIGSVLAQQLHADLDVVLIRRLVSPGKPQETIGAVSEGGQIHLRDHFSAVQAGLPEDYVARQASAQLEVLGARRRLVRSIRPPAAITGRPVILTDDGIVTGATMLAALRVIQAQSPSLLVVAVPVLAQHLVEKIQQHCDELVYLVAAQSVRELSEHYLDFRGIEDQEMGNVLARHQRQTRLRHAVPL